MPGLRRMAHVHAGIYADRSGAKAGKREGLLSQAEAPLVLQPQAHCAPVFHNRVYQDSSVKSQTLCWS